VILVSDYGVERERHRAGCPSQISEIAPRTTVHFTSRSLRLFELPGALAGLHGNSALGHTSYR
jgi:hypothetical protein